MSETVTIEQVLQDVHPELSADNNTYRLFRLNEVFSLDRLSNTDIAYYKRVNNFVKGAKLVVVQNSKIIYIED